MIEVHLGHETTASYSLSNLDDDKSFKSSDHGGYAFKLCTCSLHPSRMSQLKLSCLVVNNDFSISDSRIFTVKIPKNADIHMLQEEIKGKQPLWRDQIWKKRPYIHIDQAAPSELCNSSRRSSLGDCLQQTKRYLPYMCLLPTRLEFWKIPKRYPKVRNDRKWESDRKGQWRLLVNEYPPCKKSIFDMIVNWTVSSAK